MKDDVQFHEFLEAHKNKSQRTIWSNDLIPGDMAKLKESQQDASWTGEQQQLSTKHETVSDLDVRRVIYMWRGVVGFIKAGSLFISKDSLYNIV